MKIANMMLLVFLGAVVTTAQELNIIQSADTLFPKSLVFPGPQNSLGRPSLLPPLRLADVAITREFPTSSFGIALLSEPPVPEKRAELYWQMGLTQKNEDPLEAMRMMLQAAEAGGAAYIAYRHMMKYGFLK